MNISYWLFLFDFALVFYVLGAAFIEGFVNYRTWHLIGTAEFRAYHQAVGPRIQGLLVAPHGLTLVLTFLLLWWRPGPIPLWSVGLSLALNLVPVVVTSSRRSPSSSHLIARDCPCRNYSGSFGENGSVASHIVSMPSCSCG